MTPCDLCHRDHWGTTCDGFPLMLLDDVDEPECPVCYAPRCQSERVCAECRREAAQLARVVMPALDELWWRRVNHKTLGGDVCKAVPGTHSAGAERVTRPVVPTTAAGAGPREPAFIPSAIVDSDTATAGVVVSTPEKQRLATAVSGDAGSTPARCGSVGTPTVTAGAIPAQGGSSKPLDALGIYALVCIVGGLAGWA